MNAAAVLAFDHGERDTGDRDRPGRETRQVEPPSLRVGALGNEPRRGGEARDPERQVEPEDPAPAAARDEHPAEHRPDRERDTGDRGPDPECAGTLAPVGIDVTDQRERARLACGRAHAHDDAGDDQRARVGCERADERPRAEEHDAGEHHALSSEQVAKRSAGEHQPSEREHVAVDDPLERGHAGAQRGLDVRQRDADDRVVEEREEEDRADRGECSAAVHATCVAMLNAGWLVEPAVAVTRAASAWPLSAAVTANEALVAPAIGVHTRPFALQRRQAYVYV